MNPTCVTCRFWQRAGAVAGHAVGRCRRHAPQAAASGENGVARAHYPLTTDADWCGDHAAAANGNPAPVETSEPRSAAELLAQARAAASGARGTPRAAFVLRSGALFATPAKGSGADYQAPSWTTQAREAARFATDQDATAALAEWRASGARLGPPSDVEVTPWTM